VSDDFDYMLEDAQRPQMRPYYRYLEPLPEPDYGRFGRGLRWGLLIAAFLWALILLAGFLVASTFGGP
jgi:hypothetical protein